MKYPQHIHMLLPVNTWGVSKRLPLHRMIYWYMQQTNLIQMQYRWVAKSRWLAKWFISYALIGDKNCITESLIDEVLVACAGDVAGKSMQDFQRSSTTIDGTIPYYIDQLAQLSLPITFVHGDLDPLVKKEDVIMAASSAQNAKVVILEGCKHWSAKERPAQFFNIIEASTSKLA